MNSPSCLLLQAPAGQPSDVPARLLRVCDKVAPRVTAHVAPRATPSVTAQVGPRVTAYEDLLSQQPVTVEAAAANPTLPQVICRYAMRQTHPVTGRMIWGHAALCCAALSL